ncbi:MAG: HEPN domain-containing protein [Treponema sp.]|jgi:HEPN domain-containing protein|nr:HEPN domain-containing protein [Treponema sp.]
MDKQTELQQWIEIANNDLAVAQYLAKNMHMVSYEIVCFHCQQAVEKYLKWVLVLHDIEPPKIHDKAIFL